MNILPILITDETRKQVAAQPRVLHQPVEKGINKGCSLVVCVVFFRYTIFRLPQSSASMDFACIFSYLGWSVLDCFGFRTQSFCGNGNFFRITEES